MLMIVPPFAKHLPARIGSPEVRAFTILELLAVTAIVMVLGALVIAGLGRAREAADRAACLSNLRQLGIAARLYIDEQGEFPSWQHWYFSSTSNDPNDRGFREYFMGTTEAVPTESRTMTKATSPLLARRFPPYSGSKHTYAMNIHLSSHKTYGLTSPRLVEHPSKMMHFMYGLAGNRNVHGQHFYTPYLYTLTGSGSLNAKGTEGLDRFYDHGYSSILYFDGSASRISREEATTKFLKADTPEAKVFWRGRKE